MGACQEPECGEESGVACVLPDDTIAGEYCLAHAFANGFCKGCGEFWAGLESFDFGNGYCANCNADADDADYVDPDYDDGWWVVEP